MKRALIDVGNTRTKLALAEDDRLTERRQIATAEISTESVARALKGWPTDNAVLCSVVPASQDAFERTLGSSLIVVRHDLPLGIGIDYPDPASIGPDRLANAVALAKMFGTPGIVVDFGTAVTFDVVSAEGAYCGGVIAPGLEMMNEYMSERTALLPRVTVVKRPPPVGRTTEGAMQSGAYYGYAGMVRRILDELLPTFPVPGEVRLVATGGAAVLFHDELGVDIYEPDLTLHGLRLIGEGQHSGAA